MNEQQITESLRKLRWETSEAMDQQIMADAMEALREAPCAPRPVGFRMMLGDRRLRVAAMLLVVLGLAVVIGITMLAQPSLSLAQVQEAFERQQWVHVKYDNGRERWSSLTDGRNFYREEDGRITYTEPSGLRLTYWPPDRIIGGGQIQQSRWFRGERPELPLPQSVWEEIVAPLELSAMQANGYVERHRETLDGRSLVRFDIYQRDALDQRVLTRQLWVDPQTRLPVRVRERVPGMRVEQRWIIGEYAFPAQGPRDIYDLGVPRGLPIVEPPGEPTEQVAQMLEASKQAQAGFPQTYRLITWEVPNPKLDNYTMADLIYRDGVRERFARYFVPARAGVETTEQMLQWMERNTPVEVHLYDAERMVSRLGPMPESFVDREPVRARITRSRPEQRPPSSWLAEQYQWPHIDWGARLQLIAPAEPHVPAGLLQLRRGAGDSGFEHWLDPSRGYVCVNEIWSRDLDGEMKKIREEQLDELVQLPGGAWYARTKRVLDYGVYPRLRAAPRVTTWVIQIDVTPADHFPPGTFDWQPLLEGAEVETQ